MTVEWIPDFGVVQRIVNVLKEANSPNTEVQQRITVEIKIFDSMPFIPCYYSFIFSNNNIEDVEIRQRAGLLLKLRIPHLMVLPKQLPNSTPNSHRFDTTDSADNNLIILRYIKQSLLITLYDPHKTIRSTAGTILAAFVRYQGFDQFEELLPFLLQSLNYHNNDVVISSFQTIAIILEDITENYYSPNYSTYQSVDETHSKLFKFCSQHFVPKFLSWANSETPLDKRYLSILSLSYLNKLFASNEYLSEYASSYWNCVLNLASDSSVDIIKIIAKILWYASFTMPSLVIDHLQKIMVHILDYLSSSQAYDVKLHSIFFLSTIIKNPSSHTTIEKFFSKLLPLLIENTKYSEYDYMQMNLSQFEDDNASYPDKIEDIEPQFHKKSNLRKLNATYISDDSELDSDEDDFDNENTKGAWGKDWTVRKASAMLIDYFSTLYGDNILSFVLPHIEERLNSTDWEIKETGVLTIGAIARGCIDGLEPFLPKILEILISLCNDRKPILRSISLWAVSRFSLWIAPQPEILKLVTETILLHVLDSNKCVQEASCSAIACLEEEANDALVEHLPVIISTFNKALNSFQSKNMILILDSIRTLSESLGTQLDIPIFYEFIVEPLFNKWVSCDISEPSLIMMFECVASMILSIEKGLTNYADGVLRRCLEVSQIVLGNINLADSNTCGYEPYMDLIECSLDTISSLCEKMKGDFSSLMNISLLIPIIEQCCQLKASPSYNGIKQGSFALIGDLAENTPHLIIPMISKLVPLLIPYINSTEISLSNNACWAIGQLSFYTQKGNDKSLEPFVKPIAIKLVDIMTYNNKNLANNASLTMGRLALVYPEIISPVVNSVFNIWCSNIETSTNDHDKIVAFQGLCNVINNNPTLVINNMKVFLDTVTSLYFFVPSSSSSDGLNSERQGNKDSNQLGSIVPLNIHNVILNLLEWLRITFSEEWETAVNSLSPLNKSKIDSYFHTF